MRRQHLDHSRRYKEVEVTLSKCRAKYLSVSALLAIVGILFSGPLGILLVEAYGPQPSWQNAAVFVDNYDSIQAMPYAFGFLLILGFLLFFASLLNSGRDQQRPIEAMGLILSAVFGSLVSLNYIIQVAYIPNALEQNEAILSFVAMANPQSLTWALEMFGWGILGLATLVVAPLFSGRGLQRVIKWLLIFNGVASVGGAVAVTFDLSEVMSSPALIGYYLWNALIVVIMILVIVEFRFGRNLKGE
jgi:MFS family permease